MSKLYKTINDLSNYSLNLKKQIDFYYIKDNEFIKLSTKELDGKDCISLIDHDCVWNNECDSIFMDVELTIENTKELFGTNGICFDDAVLGVGIEWHSKKSRIKNGIKIGTITKDNDRFVSKLDKIEIFEMSEDVEFSCIIYINKPGKTNGNFYLANTFGLIVDSTVFLTIINVGYGSIFPLFNYEKTGDPLWKVYCNTSDIYNDEFNEETIKVYLNTKHPAFKYISMQGEDSNLLFFKQTLAEIVVCLVMNIKNTLDTPDKNVDFEKETASNTIATFLRYLNSVKNIKINGNYEELVESIHLSIDKGDIKDGN